MKELAPSILAADFYRLGEEIRCLEQEGIRILHIDVMDGMFVPSISFGMPVIASLRAKTDLFFDVHLMVQEPVRYLKDFADAGADGITVHIEACRDIGETLHQLAQFPVRRGLSIKPDTPVKAIEKYLHELDLVLVMSVEPGFGGQKLIPETLDKVKRLKQLREECGYRYQIEVDGGVNEATLETVLMSGTDIAVAGTAVFQGNIKENLRYLRGVLADAS